VNCHFKDCGLHSLLLHKKVQLGHSVKFVPLASAKERRSVNFILFIYLFIFYISYDIVIHHNIHSPFMGKEMLSTNLLDLENKYKLTNMFVHN